MNHLILVEPVGVVSAKSRPDSDEKGIHHRANAAKAVPEKDLRLRLEAMHGGRAAPLFVAPYGVPVGFALGLACGLCPSRWSWEAGGMARTRASTGRER